VFVDVNGELPCKKCLSCSAGGGLRKLFHRPAARDSIPADPTSGSVSNTPWHSVTFTAAARMTKTSSIE